jgi:hypothetical protein
VKRAKRRKNPTPFDVADFMVGEFEAAGSISQRAIAHEIKDRFGAEFTFLNKNGNYGICGFVLAQFKALTPHAVWDKRLSKWRLRRPDDSPGRQQ